MFVCLMIRIRERIKNKNRRRRVEDYTVDKGGEIESSGRSRGGRP